MLVTPANKEPSDHIPITYYITLLQTADLWDINNDILLLKQFAIDVATAMVYLWDYWQEFFELEDDELPSEVTFGGLTSDELAARFLKFGEHFYFYSVIDAFMNPLAAMLGIREVTDLSKEGYDFFAFI